jgi:hypothetical protein
VSPVDARGVAYTSQNSTDTHIYGLAIALSIVQNESLIGKGLVCGTLGEAGEDTHYIRGSGGRHTYRMIRG